jgi:putative membrane protein
VIEMMGFDGYGMSGSWWLYGGLMMLLFWGALAGLIVWLVRRFSGPSIGPDSAQEVLKRRFAAGEISSEDYERTRHALMR